MKRPLLLLCLGLLLGAPPPARAAKPEDSVVKVTASVRYPNPTRPWAKGNAVDVTGSGVVIDGKKVLTSAHRETLAALGGRVIVLGTDVTDDDGVHSAFLARHGAVAYLARPDFIVYGTAAVPGDAPELIDGLSSQLAAPVLA